MKRKGIQTIIHRMAGIMLTLMIALSVSCLDQGSESDDISSLLLLLIGGSGGQIIKINIVGTSAGMEIDWNEVEDAES
jgi:hypothetical protein